MEKGYIEFVWFWKITFDDNKTKLILKLKLAKLISALWSNTNLTIPVYKTSIEQPTQNGFNSKRESIPVASVGIPLK